MISAGILSDELMGQVKRVRIICTAVLRSAYVFQLTMGKLNGFTLVYIPFFDFFSVTNVIQFFKVNFPPTVKSFDAPQSTMNLFGKWFRFRRR